jgi:SCY1-like protein 2
MTYVFEERLTPFSDILPVIFNALESPTPSLVDAALRSLPSVLPQLDFSTIKNELFPVIAAIFSRTNSLAIKVRGLQAFVTLCGGSADPNGDDGLDGLAPQKKKATSSSALDKYTMQEKIVPLIKAIKTKEPAVMMAALNVLRVIGKVADADFVAMDILPILWSMSLGPLLDLKQFQAFMELIKTLSGRVEEEQTRKLQELAGSNTSASAMKDDFMSFGPVAGSSLDANGTTETDFEQLVKGESGAASANPLESGWDTMASTTTLASPSSTRKSTPTATFSWSSPPAAPVAAASNQINAVKAQQPGFRTVTPDLGSFQPITPTVTQFSQPLQPTTKTISSITPTPSTQQTTSINWGAAAAPTSSSNNLWSSPPAAQQPPTSAFGSLSLGPPQQAQNRAAAFSLPPPPGASGSTAAPSGLSSFSLAPPPGTQTQPQRPPLSTTTSTPAFGGLGAMNSLNSLSSMGSNTASGTGIGMGMGMAAMKPMSTSTSMGNGASMNSMMSLGGMGQQLGQGQNQNQKSGLDKYESLL